MEIKKGDQFECIADVVMDNGSTDYIKGKIYKSDNNDCITDETGDEHHEWTEDDPAMFFKKVEPIKTEAPDKKYKIAIITWEDIISSDSNWRDTDDAIHWSDSESGIVHQVGYLLDQDDKYVLLMDSFFPSSETVGAVTRIPQAVIKSIKIIEPKDQ